MLSDFLPEAVQQRIRHFIDEVYVPWGIKYLPSEASERYENDDPEDEDAWWNWNLVESPVVESDILSLEQAIGAPLPPLFRAWFMFKSLPETDFGWVRLPHVLPNAPLKDLCDSVQWMNDERMLFRKRNVFPFADDGNDTGPLCFDLTRPLPDGDYPILLFDHELLHQPEYAGMEVAESFSRLLDLIEASLLNFDKQPRPQSILHLL